MENGVVLRVEYKGNISYRNAAKKFSHLKRDSHGVVIRAHKPSNGTKFTGLLTHTIAELVLQEPDYLELGVPGQELIKNILEKDSVRYTKKYVTILLDKEVQIGSLIKMENGNYLVGPVRGDIRKMGGATEKKNETQPTSKPVFDLHLQDAKIKRRPGPKPGFRKDKYVDGSLNVLSLTAGDRGSDNGNLRVGGRRKVRKK